MSGGLSPSESGLPDSFDEYRLKRLLGAGSMGQVWLAEDTLLERPVAIKVIAAQSPSPVARERFFHEARTLARLSHPNIVAIHRVGVVKGIPYLVSEYVRGTPLDRVDTPVAVPRALAIAVDLARGLAAAHRRGVLHRDLKPANAIEAEEGGVKLLDFGIAELLTGPPPGRALAPAAPSAVRARARPDHDATVTLAGASDAGDIGHAETLGSPSASQDGEAGALAVARCAFAGTPLYAAPEIFRGEPATPLSDVYSLGALLFEVCSGVPARSQDSFADLAAKAQSEPAPPLLSVAPGADPRFAEIVDRCLERDPALRFSSADALRAALERLTEAEPAPTTGTEIRPYRGLRPFGPEHRRDLFGRGDEAIAIADLLVSQSLVLVVGDSGAGKSSLCRAAAIPRFHARTRAVLSPIRPFTPGAGPLAALAVAIAEATSEDADELHRRLRAEPAHLPRMLRRSRPNGVLLFVDQLEELCTLAAPEEAALFAEAVHALLRSPGPSRLIAAARSDHLSSLAALPSFGELLSSALYIIRPLDADALREAIVGPAQARGYAFEPATMVDRLVHEAQAAPGGLPLLEFALDALWDLRDEDAKLIRESALVAMGGVAGALSRHADTVLSAMPAEERACARSLLLQLVTEGGTSAQYARADLLARVAAAPADRALEALIAGRLVVARDQGGGGSVLSIAHESLLEGWDTLRGWLGKTTEVRAAKSRLYRAASEWDRRGRPADLLWSPRLLEETTDLGKRDVDAFARAFLDASRRAARVRSALRFAAIAAFSTGIALAAVGARAQSDGAREREMEAHLSVAREHEARARDATASAAGHRAEALALFDAWKEGEAESVWGAARKDAAIADAAFARAAQEIEVSLLLSAGRPAIRARLAEVLDLRARLKQAEGRVEERDELLSRLAAYDDGARVADWRAPGSLTITTEPSGARVSIARVEAVKGSRVESAPEAAGTTPVIDLKEAQGSCVLILEREGYAPVRLPLWIGRGEALSIDVPLLPAAAAPEGFVYVPAGRFLFGSPEPDDRRARSGRHPLHPRSTDAFLIARTEVTFADWIAYLRALPEAERAARTPHLKDEFNALDLSTNESGRYRLSLRPSSATYAAAEGEKIRYPARDRRSEQDWLKMPVSAISFDEARAYMDWLRDTGRVPGARLCHSLEWERAARGADDRVFPHADRLAPDDANHDATYGRQPLGFGPDEVGSHPAGRSPFGVDDMAGNVWEWVAPFQPGGPPVARGGSFYQVGDDALVFNFEKMEPKLRSALIGLRVCATPRALR